MIEWLGYLGLGTILTGFAITIVGVCITGVIFSLVGGVLKSLFDK